MHCVDLGESFPTSIYLQKSASIQPRTSPSKFGGKYSILFTRVLTCLKAARYAWEPRRSSGCHPLVSTACALRPSSRRRWRRGLTLTYFGGAWICASAPCLAASADAPRCNSGVNSAAQGAVVYQRGVRNMAWLRNRVCRCPSHVAQRRR